MYTYIYIYICLYLSIFGVDINLWLRAFAKLRGELPSIMSGCSSEGSSQATSDSKDHDGPNTEDAAPNDEVAGPKYGCTKCRWR